MTSTPTSVSISTASSPRSPLGIAWTTTSRGISAGVVATSSDLGGQPLLAGLQHPAGRHAAAPVGQGDALVGLDPAYDGGVVALVAGEVEQVTGGGGGNTVVHEHGEAHRLLLSGWAGRQPLT